MGYNAWGLRAPATPTLRLAVAPSQVVELAGMSWPVLCNHCHAVYDAGRVNVIARYLDCSVWRAPCCGLTVDDRRDKSRRDITELRRDGTER